MSVNRPLPVAAAFGVLVGALVYRFCLPDWYPTLAIAAVYTGTAYFYLAFDISLLGTQVDFDARADKLGYGIGLFGLSVSPLALGEYAGLPESAVVGVVVWLTGMIAFLLVATTAAHRDAGA